MILLLKAILKVITYVFSKLFPQYFWMFWITPI
jgi:hypothetical protein